MHTYMYKCIHVYMYTYMCMYMCISCKVAPRLPRTMFNTVLKACAAASQVDMILQTISMIFMTTILSN